MNRISALLAATAFALSASPALAHPKLESGTPAANATVKPTKQIQLRFNEKLIPAFSGAIVVMTGMPGIAHHGEKKVGGKASVGKDGKTLLILLAKPLAAGDYRVDWYAVARDTHRIKGGHSFKVR